MTNPTTTPQPATPAAVAPDSAALRLAERVIALGRHLRHNSTLPAVDIDGRPFMDDVHLDLMIATRTDKGEPGGADAVLRWAKTLTDATVQLHPHSAGITRVMAFGRVDTFMARVWTTDTGDLHLWMPDRKATVIPLQQLVDYVATGSVDIAAEAGR